MVKKLVLFFFIVFPFAGKSQFTIIPELGASYHHIKSNENPNEKFKVGFVGGASYINEFLNRFEFHSSVLFYQKGERTVVPDISISNLTYNYVDIPLVLSYGIKGDLHLNFGISPSLLMRSRAKVKSLIGDQTVSITSINLKDVNNSAGRYNRVDLGGVIGLTYISNSFHYKLNYVHGIIPIFQPNVPQPTHIFAKNRGVYFTIGLPITIKE